MADSIKTVKETRELAGHTDPPKAGILLANLGTPDRPDSAALRKYLREFLWDRRVVEVPRPIWWLILNLVIVPFRSPRSAEAYRRVWTERGSPLLYYTRDLAEAMEHEFRRNQPQVRVYPAMRYGSPGIVEALEQARRDNVQRLIVLPMYPQYSATTTASVFDGLANALKKVRWIPELRFITHYHYDEAWVEAVADRIKAHQEAHGKPEKLLFSFHGIPKKYLLKGDPYYCECQSSARRIAARLKLEPEAWQVTFQSRLGREEWLKPYTDETLLDLAGKGVKHVQVVCPGFAVDCLETIDEIGVENREAFEHAGGEKLEYIPALNAEPDHARVLAELCWRHGQGWPEFSKQAAIAEDTLAERARRAETAAKSLGLED
ncbi:MAG: ferrochelatase [Wenzhouxiangellaceae bacterium]|jgi:ferrochelatase|nr:ferrochelatase [Wenzhouxiangellaceae bacterium]MBS3746060.1 ferrochelatase [Wenzhouxiangellaceae bacterium]MBS3822557.1 ferrochelatase [Wenzhouxiangellaceae bacterium]